MATTTETKIIEIKVPIGEGIKQIKLLTDEIERLRAGQADLKKGSEAEKQQYEKNAIAIKEYTRQKAVLQREVQTEIKDTQSAMSAYQKLQTEYTKAAAKAKDLAAAHGVGSEKAKAAADSAFALGQRLKDIDASVNQHQRNVGNYSGALEDLNNKYVNGLSGIQNFITANGGLAGSFRAVGQAALQFGKQLLLLLANPIVATFAAIAGAVMLLVNAMKQNGAATEKFNQILAPFKALIAAITTVLGKFGSILLDGVLVVGKWANAVMSLIPGLDKIAEKNQEAIRLEREKQKLIREGIVDTAADAKEELRISELKKKIMQADKYSVEQRLAFAREVDKAEKALALDDANRANRRLKNFLDNMKLQGKAQKDYTVDELQQLSDLQAEKYAKQQEYYDKTRRTASHEATLIAEIEKEKNAKIEKSNADREKKQAERDKRKSDQDAKDKAAAEEKVRLAKEAADKAIANLDYELQLFQSKQAEAAAKTNQTNKQIYDDKIKLLNEQYLTEGLKLEEQLANNQITQEDYDKQSVLLTQQKNTAIAQENQAFEQAERDRKLAAASTDLQNELAIAEMKHQSLYDLKMQQLEADYQAELLAAEKTGADTFLIDQKYTELKKKLNQEELSAKMDMASGFAGNIAEIFGKNTKVGKAAASAQVAIDTTKGAMAAFTSMQSIPVVGPVLGAAAAGAVIAKGAKSIKDIWAVKSGLPGDGGGGSPSLPPDLTSKMASPLTNSVQAMGAMGGSNAITSGAANAAISPAFDYNAMAKVMSNLPAPELSIVELRTKERQVDFIDNISTLKS